MKKEIIIDIKSENYSRVEKFVESSHGSVSAWGGNPGKSVDRMYGGGISLRCFLDEPSEHSEHQIVINIPQNFTKEKLKELEKLATS